MTCTDNEFKNMRPKRCMMTGTAGCKIADNCPN